jgi:Tfp pilus assembly protein PilO
MTDMRKWSAGSVVLIVAILAAGWFLLISPKHHTTSDLKSKVTAQESDNARLQAKLQELQAQQQDLPKQQAQLAELKTRIPDNPALPSLIRDLTAAARKVGVSIDSMTPSTPVAAVAASPTAAVESPATAAPPSSTVLFAVPLGLSITGSYFELEQYLNKLEGLQRSFLVSGFTLSPSAATGAATTGASSDTTSTQLTVAIVGRVFLTQPAPPAATTPVAPATTSTDS